MLTSSVVVTLGVVVAVLVGAIVGWLCRGQVARWCPKHGIGLTCGECARKPADSALWRRGPDPDATVVLPTIRAAGVVQAADPSVYTTLGAQQRAAARRDRRRNAPVGHDGRGR